MIGQIMCTLSFFCDVQIGKQRSEKNWLGDNGMENSRHVFCHFRTAREIVITNYYPQVIFTEHLQILYSFL